MDQSSQTDLQHRIRERAHHLWEQAGCPDGRDDEFWHQAEHEIRDAEQLHDEATAPPPTILPG
ncbi:conserved protein of unknown function [Bradyrhizobium sp. ORS 285]|uniref:DUF2934 domain-containing protein n=1 Tax=Bradyrhizobium sp. ORS 285 TaxID=115808 RepID=UPI0002406720|nr:DUF2934 domain-containing protein [Bradyrhizobium sp. ORS 285]CCD84300.1 conserved hypothetical protein [Bradyrhizobium sp. ORS 285]SMX56943.1 conserved protein of unknown function [Bradyrhizobium sp. ORS 285]